MDHQSRILSHPVFRNLKDTSIPALRGSFKHQLPSSSPYRERRGKSGFVISVSPIMNALCKGSPVLSSSPKAIFKHCLFCNEAHSIDSCSQINKKSHQDKLEFLKRKGVCFGCLEAGHMSKGCKQRLTCQVSSLKHPTTFHITNKEANTYKEKQRKVHNKCSCGNREWKE